MADDISINNVVKVFPHNGSFFDPVKVEKKARLLVTQLVSVLLKHHGQDASLAEIVVDKFSLDDCLDMESSVARIMGNATMRASGETQKVEIVPFENDSQRFLAWSLAATTLSPRPTSNQVAEVVGSTSDDVIDSYLHQVKDLSGDLVSGNLDIFRRS